MGTQIQIGFTKWLTPPLCYSNVSLQLLKVEKKRAIICQDSTRDQEGYYLGEDLQRFKGRINLDFTPTDFLKMGARYNYSNVNYDK